MQTLVTGHTSHQTQITGQATVVCQTPSDQAQAVVWTLGSWSACPAPDWSERSSNTARPAEKLDRFGLVAASSKKIDIMLYYYYSRDKRLGREGRFLALSTRLVFGNNKI